MCIRDRSQSEADLAFCSHLAFWCGRDIAQMDRLFRHSGLYRDKWDRPQSGSTYGQITLEKAVSLCSSTYQPVMHTNANEDFGILAPRLAELKPDSNRRYGWSDNGAGRLFADVYKSCARSVSYTHLDVYKRQSYTLAPKSNGAATSKAIILLHCIASSFEKLRLSFLTQSNSCLLYTSRCV